MIGEDVPVPTNPPGDAVTVYDVMAAPPSFVGGVKLTVASAKPPTADISVGASGTVAFEGGGPLELLVELVGKQHSV
jgi:hypothetical protein